MVLTASEVLDVLGRIESSELRGLAELLYRTGMRMSEALQLRIKDIELATGWRSSCVTARAARTGWSCCLELSD